MCGCAEVEMDRLTACSIAFEDGIVIVSPAAFECRKRGRVESKLESRDTATEARVGLEVGEGSAQSKSSAACMDSFGVAAIFAPGRRGFPAASASALRSACARSSAIRRLKAAGSRARTSGGKRENNSARDSCGLASPRALDCGSSLTRRARDHGATECRLGAESATRHD